jgi:hypothetical protein
MKGVRQSQPALDRSQIVDIRNLLSKSNITAIFNEDPSTKYPVLERMEKNSTKKLLFEFQKRGDTQRENCIFRFESYEKLSMCSSHKNH